MHVGLIRGCLEINEPQNEPYIFLYISPYVYLHFYDAFFSLGFGDAASRFICKPPRPLFALFLSPSSDCFLCRCVGQHCTPTTQPWCLCAPPRISHNSHCPMA